MDPDYASALGVGLPGLRGLEATALVIAGVRRHAGFVRAGAPQRLDAQEGLARIRPVDGRVDHGPRPASKVATEERVGLCGNALNRESEAPERLERIFSEKRVFDYTAGIGLDARSLQAKGSRIKFGHSESWENLTPILFRSLPPDETPLGDGPVRRSPGRRGSRALPRRRRQARAPRRSANARAAAARRSAPVA
jgi:hypothetical protein